VGAAIAAGNQAEKGICALLVHAERIKIIKKIFILLSDIPLIKLNVQWPLENIIPIHIRIPTSPRRLVKAVIIPALYDLLL
jgi:hypothetical protein